MINDFHRWTAWSPWEKLDPAMTRTYSGSPAGVGAVYEWAGSSKVGQGRMEILESSPSRIKIKLDFVKPIEGHNIAEFTLEPQGSDTRVTWAMSGPSPFLSKLIGIFINMDTMIGKDFEQGLSNLRDAAGM